MSENYPAPEIRDRIIHRLLCEAVCSASTFTQNEGRALISIIILENTVGAIANFDFWTRVT
ncbi:MAG: hypothetical protein AB1589_29290 [Cyanobacteriota bacterium]